MKQPESNHNNSANGSELRTITITLPSDVYERLLQESVNRKIARAPNRSMVAMLREAVTQYLERAEKTPREASSLHSAQTD